MDSDEVNSIGDNTEARQIANIVKTAYFNILARTSLTKHKKTFALDDSTDINLPVLMYKPANVVSIEWIKYLDQKTTQDNWKYATILPLRQYIDHIDTLVRTAPEVDSLTLNGATYYFYNDRQPEYCTIVQNYYVIFDGYNQDLDVTLQSSKSESFGVVSPEFELSDSFVPDLDDYLFPLLLNEATEQAFLELKQVDNPIAARDSKRQWVSLQKKQTVNSTNPPSFQLLPNFGRNIRSKITK
jgi:hypothetical protein